jgi:hypothetical protein
MKYSAWILTAMVMLMPLPGVAQDSGDWERAQSSLYDVPPRWLIDMPTAGTLPRAYFDIGFRFYPSGGTIASTNIGLSNRMMLGVSFGGEGIISNDEPIWNPKIEFNIKLRVIDEQEYFPAFSLGFCSQGNGFYNDEWDRYTFKSRGLYAVVSRSFYFYNWTSGWHLGLNYSTEFKKDDEKDINFFVGFDATFKYNLALVAEYDVALNDNRSGIPAEIFNDQGEDYDVVFSGKGRGYLNWGIRWLFARDLELELLLKDLLVNRRESRALTREIRLTYIDRF